MRVFALPAVQGHNHPGLAGVYSGFIGDTLIIAGGANFPEGKPWEGGSKKWWSTLYYTNIEVGNMQWQTIENALPEPLAYGVTIQLPNSLLCIGGCNAVQCSKEVFEIKLHDGQLSLSRDWPPLPVPLANMTGALIGNNIYIAGGQESMETQKATSHFFTLNILKDKDWTALPSWPGVPRGYAVSAAQKDGTETCFYLFSGRNYNTEEGSVEILTDGYCYHPQHNTWRKLEGIFPVMAATALSVAPHHLLFFGGAQSIIAGSDNHPGFDNNLRLYNIPANTLENTGAAPYPLPVTTNTIRRGEIFYITSGEIKPGIRTPDILRGKIKTTESFTKTNNN
jgi:N-acetylneuraminic acid mutarotase